ncbi:MAG: hypothetical protein V7749_01610, partial [Cocleimonas sp.]
MNNSFKQKTRFRKAGLLLSISILTASNVFANNSHAATKDPSLVAFYNEVFGIKPNNIKTQKHAKRRVIKPREISYSNNCIPFPPRSDTEFALDLRKQNERRNLRLIMSDTNITKYSSHVQDEISRMQNIDTEVFLDLVQKDNKDAYIILGERKVRCKQVKPSKSRKTIVIEKSKPIPTVEPQLDQTIV